MKEKLKHNKIILKYNKIKSKYNRIKLKNKIEFSAIAKWCKI